MPGFVLQAAPIPAELVPAVLGLPAVRVGFTVSRKVIPGQARPDLDYVLVGRQAALARDFAALRQELFEALKRLKALAVATP